jgi:hypothetical protein
MERTFGWVSRLCGTVRRILDNRRLRRTIRAAIQGGKGSRFQSPSRKIADVFFRTSASAQDIKASF